MTPSMTPAQLEAALGRLGWTRLQASVELGVSTRTVFAWLAGTRTIPGPVVILLRLLERDHDRLRARRHRRARAPRTGGRAGPGPGTRPGGSEGHPA